MDITLQSLIYNRNFAGNGQLQGIVLDSKQKPLQRLVTVYEEVAPPGRSNKEVPRTFVGQKRSDPHTGKWLFSGLSELKTYMVITHDNTGEFDPVVKVNLKPEPME